MKKICNEKLENLAKILIEDIKNNTDPFNTITIIVPSLLTEQWLKAYWLKACDKVLMNVKFMRMFSFINELGNDKNQKILNSNALSLHICNELLNNSSHYSEINSYYKNNNINNINNINLLDLSHKLSTLFLKYEIEETPLTGWQKKLYDQIKQNSNNRTLKDCTLNLKYTGKVYAFGFTKIEKLYENVLSNLDDCTVLLLENKEENNKIKEVVSCQSKEREIEFVYDTISKLLKDDINKNSFSFSDILVIATDLKEYVGPITKVFSNASNKDFPQIPTVIVNPEKSNTNVSLLLNLLFEITKKDQFTRNDLYKILSNPNVQKARKIDPTKILDIIDALERMNVYRNISDGDIISNEWLYAAKRLLISKLIGNSFDDSMINIGEDEYLPYGTISMDDDAINILVSVIEDIESLRNNKENLDATNLRTELDKWLSYFVVDDVEANFYYNASLEVLDIINDNKLNLPRDIIFEAMITASLSINVFPSNVLTEGVTFVNFNENAILGAKYVFFIGMSNNNLPRLDKVDELDLRIHKSLTDIDRETYNYLINNAEEVYCSYTNVDLITLEEYQLSTLVKFDKEIDNETYKLSEKRPYNKLFSNSEFIKREYNDKLTKDFSTTKLNKDATTLPKSEYFETVKQKELSSFIIEPMMAKMDKLFKDYDDSVDNASKNYEPIETSALVESIIQKELMKELIVNGELSEDAILNIYNKHKNLHNLPYTISDLENEVEKTNNYYNSFNTDLTVDNLIKPFDLEIDYLNHPWVLKIESEFIYFKNEDKHYFYELTSKNFSKYSKLANIYIASLAYVINNIKPKEEITICLCGKAEYNKTYEEAIETLNVLYEKYNDFSDFKYLPIDNIFINEYDKFIASPTRGPWQFFDDAKLINLKDKNGYDRDNYNDTFAKYKEFIFNYVNYVKEKEKEEK